MLLSDAIRLGATITVPLTGHYISVTRSRACAIGAAGVAIGLKNITFEDLVQAFPILMVEYTGPDKRCQRWGFYALCHHIIVLNDIEHMDRVLIADVVDAFERRIAPLSVEAAEELCDSGVLAAV